MSLAFVDRLRVGSGDCDPQGVVFGEMCNVFLGVAGHRQCPIPNAVWRGLEPYLADPELEGLARGGLGTARHDSLAP